MSPTLVALKVILVPFLIAAITLAGRRWGPTVAGWLSGLPVVAGPILFFIALEQGPAFAATAAVGTLLGILAVLMFNLGYAWAAMRMAWHGSLLSGLAVYFATVALLSQWDASMAFATTIVLAVLLVAPRLFPRVQARAATAAPARGEIFLRMAAGAALVLSITYFASAFGPHLSGLFAMFPVISIVLAVFSHRHCGHEFAIRLLRGIVLGWYAFGAFCLVLGWALPSFTVGAAFLMALLCAAAVQLASRRWVGTRPADQPLRP